MSHAEHAPVAVVGGGLAGLTAASFLKRHGVPVVLYEASKQIAGLATSFHDPDGFTYDFGAHFITNRLASAVGIGAQCRTVASYGESVLVRGKTYRYPLGLVGVGRFVASALFGRAAVNRDSSAAEWFRATYGEALAEEVAIPLLEGWSGAAAGDLAASVG